MNTIDILFFLLVINQLTRILELPFKFFCIILNLKGKEQKREGREREIVADS